MIHILYTGNAMSLELDGLHSRYGSGFVNSATVAASLTDASGNAVTGAAWPMTLDYVPGSDGCYRVVLPAGLSLSLNERYTATVTVSDDSGQVAQWKLDCVCRLRRE